MLRGAPVAPVVVQTEDEPAPQQRGQHRQWKPSRSGFPEWGSCRRFDPRQRPDAGGHVGASSPIAASRALPAACTSSQRSMLTQRAPAGPIRSTPGSGVGRSPPTAVPARAARPAGHLPSGTLAELPGGASRAGQAGYNQARVTAAVVRRGAARGWQRVGWAGERSRRSSAQAGLQRDRRVARRRSPGQEESQMNHRMLVAAGGLAVLRGRVGGCPCRRWPRRRRRGHRGATPTCRGSGTSGPSRRCSAPRSVGDQAFLTEEEAANQEREVVERNDTGCGTRPRSGPRPGATSGPTTTSGWTRGTRTVGSRRTSADRRPPERSASRRCRPRGRRGPTARAEYTGRAPRRLVGRTAAWASAACSMMFNSGPTDGAAEPTTTTCSSSRPPTTW